MTIWSDSLDSIYESEIAVTAQLQPGDGTGSTGIDVAVIDKTIGIEIGGDGDAGLQTIRPAAYVRMATLTANSLDRSDLDNGILTINGKDWRIEAHVLRPSPDGELKGEVCMLLRDEAA